MGIPENIHAMFLLWKSQEKVFPKANLAGWYTYIYIITFFSGRTVTNPVATKLWNIQHLSFCSRTTKPKWQTFIISFHHNNKTAIWTVILLLCYLIHRNNRITNNTHRIAKCRTKYVIVIWLSKWQTLLFVILNITTMILVCNNKEM